jgi:hypothetical protein
MKKTILHSLILLGMLASLLISAAPLPAKASVPVTLDRTNLVNFIVSNRTGSAITVKLIGPSSYVLFVPGLISGYSQKTTFTVKRGVYKYTVFACNAEVVGSIDLNGRKTMIVPVCGNNPKTPEGVYKINFPKDETLARVTLVNRSPTLATIVMRGPQKYLFYLAPGEEKVYTLKRGIYAVTYYACQSSDTVAFEARPSAKFRVFCP